VFLTSTSFRRSGSRERLNFKTYVKYYISDHRPMGAELASRFRFPSGDSVKPNSALDLASGRSSLLTGA